MQNDAVFFDLVSLSATMSAGFGFIRSNGGLYRTRGHPGSSSASDRCDMVCRLSLSGTGAHRGVLSTTLCAVPIVDVVLVRRTCYVDCVTREDSDGGGVDDRTADDRKNRSGLLKRAALGGYDDEGVGDRPPRRGVRIG